QLVGHQAADDIGGAARREGHDQADGLGGILLGLDGRCDTRGQRGGGGGQEEFATLHGIPCKGGLSGASGSWPSANPAFFARGRDLRKRKLVNNLFLFLMLDRPARVAWPDVMRRFCPSLTDLQAFEVTARQGSFTLAARELCVTQGAVSKQIKHLETFLGVQLFLRSRRGLVLTEAGRGYLRRVEAALGQIEAASLALIAH